MPISREEFEKGELDPSSVVLKFFRSNADYAYTVEELMGELLLWEVDLTAETLEE